MKKGLPLGQGLTAEVFAWGENEIVKLYKKGYPFDLIENEASICQRVCELGLPVPAFSGSVEIEGRKGLIFERVRGNTLIGLTVSNPTNLKDYAKMMSELHLEVHRYDVPEIPFWGAQMADSIKKHKLLTPGERESLLEELYLRADGSTLCHGDFHPYNIVVSSRGPVIIDWGNAGRGNRAADVGLTSLGFKIGPLPQHEENKAVIEACRLEFLSVYLDKYLSSSTISSDDITQWEKYLSRYINFIKAKT